MTLNARHHVDRAYKINFQFSSFLFENQVKMCVAINLADPVNVTLVIKN